MSATELLPCPFCGATVHLRDVDGDEVVGCHDAYCAGFVNASVEGWNRRFQPEPQAMSAEEVREACADKAESEGCDQTEYRCLTIERIANAIRSLDLSKVKP